MRDTTPTKVHNEAIIATAAFFEGTTIKRYVSILER
jgi:hypothetical protein